MPLAIETRLGFGARQTFAEGGFAIVDDAATPEVDVVPLSSFNQAGAESLTTIGGSLDEDRIAYRAWAEFMVPFIHSPLPPGDNRGPIELTNVELGVAASFKMLSWMSLDYEFRTSRQPQLLDAYQVRHNLLLTFAFVLAEREQPPEGGAPAE